VGGVTISYLCAACQQEAPNSFIMKKGDKNFLVMAEKPEELISIEITLENAQKKFL
jgi:hypothetical protein